MKNQQILKALLVFFIMFLCTNIVLAKVNKVLLFTFSNISNNSTDCNIYLYDEGNYEIHIESVYANSDFSYSLIISFGKYKIKNSNLLLKDQYNGVDFNFEYHNNFVIAKKFFKCYLNKTFKNENYYSSSKPQFLEYPPIPLNKERKNFKSNHKVANILYIGTYSKNNNIILDLNKSNKYMFKYKGLLLSEGSWIREGNLLKLFDTNLKHNFYVFINKEVLICKFFPYDSDEFILEKTKVKNNKKSKK
ncbi:MAG: hypothetical protein WCR42_15720 [bacterium]